MRRVTILYKTLPSYRLEFFDGLRDALASDDIELQLVYGDAVGADKAKADTRSLPWATFRHNRALSLKGRHLIWQPALDLVKGSDLVIVEQASKLAINYLLLAAHVTHRGPRLAFWGHGANLQGHTASRLSEAAKRRYSRLPHWWFSYTNGTKDLVASLGFPRERITVVQNAIDSRQLTHEISQIDDGEIDAFLSEVGGSRGHVGLFLGSLYTDKRLDFLVEAAQHIRELDPSFVLLVAGDGPSRVLISDAAARYPFIRWLGRVDGRERAMALAASDVMLMPGLVGLAIIDAFAGAAPMITTAVDFHSPEIEYLEDGLNGRILAGDIDAAGYAAAVSDVLSDPHQLSTLTSGCRKAADIYTTEAMVFRFSSGVMAALDSLC